MLKAPAICGQKTGRGEGVINNAELATCFVISTDRKYQKQRRNEAVTI